MNEDDRIDEHLSGAFDRAFDEAARTSSRSEAGTDLAARALRRRREQIVGALVLIAALGGSVAGLRIAAGPGESTRREVTVTTTAPSAVSTTAAPTTTAPIAAVAGLATTTTSPAPTTTIPAPTTTIPAPTTTTPAPRRSTFGPTTTTTLVECPDVPGPTDPCISAARPASED